MSLGIKVFLTVILVLVGALACLIDSKKNNAGPDWIWSRDVFKIRRAIFLYDGSLRKYVKLIVVAMVFFFCGMSIFVVWSI